MEVRTVGEAKGEGTMEVGRVEDDGKDSVFVAGDAHEGAISRGGARGGQGGG